jgi:hypothetical protein
MTPPDESVTVPSIAPPTVCEPEGAADKSNTMNMTKHIDDPVKLHFEV